MENEKKTFDKMSFYRFYANFQKVVLIKLIQGHSRSKYGKLKLNGLHKDHPLVYAISTPASEGDESEDIYLLF